MSRHWPGALLWLGVAMTRAQTWPLSDVYIYRLTSVHRSSHDIVCQSYTVPCTSSARTVTVCRVISYAPSRALFPLFHSYISTATLPRAGFLPSFQVNADPVKSLLKPTLNSKPISQFPPSLYLAGCRETPCGLYFSILVSARVS